MARVTFRSRIENARDLPARCALRVTNFGLVKAALGGRYNRAVAAHRTRLPALTGIDAAIVTAMRRDGIYITSLAALGLPDAPEVLATAQRLSTDFAETARRRVREGHDFNIVPPDEVAAHPALFQLGLHDRLLDIAEAYLGLPVAYDGIHIIYTVADGRAVSTRQWHRDWEDRRMLKMVVYCNDVGPDDGPLQVLSRADGVQTDEAGYRYETCSPGEMAAQFGLNFEHDVVSCVGPAGTVVFTDTARYFHRGQPAVAKDRQALFYSYFARSPRHPFFCERSGLSRRQIAELAEGLPERQRAATLWRQDLPVTLRLIPPHRL
ncbi:hypothetical protein KX816_09015 [Sphingosinicellaceae bacterium]|nr:hypothetical protein KX816_09015 [Sphingosinicellaceae bacterium]